LTGVVRTKLWLEVDGRFAIGDGGLHLLQAIARCGSLAAAVREIGWSYRHAWGYLRQAESVLGAPLLIVRSGKGRARGAELTEFGRRVLAHLRELRRQIDGTVGPSGPSPAEVAARGRGERARRAEPRVVRAPISPRRAAGSR
jgi:molybdate transport system regulatory protein